MRLFLSTALSHDMRLTGSSKETDASTTERRTGPEESGSWFSRAKAKYGLGALLVAAGAVLFVFPEPLTSTAGIGLMLVGGVIWLASYFR